jgi:membrane-associated phospholipid phosphatase
MKHIFASVLAVILLITSVPLSAQFNQRYKARKTVSFQQDLYSKPPLLKSRGLQKTIAIPLLFTAAGLYSLTDNDLLSKYEVQEERNEWMPRFRTRADDYLQYAPIIAVYGLNALGVKGKNNFGNRTALLIKSELLVGILTYSIKKITAVPRPDTGAPTSLPSGHTAQAFAAATFMAKEYGHKSVWYSIGAYTVATGIGAIRVMNNRHWVSDVLVGAGIGILSTNLAYLTHQYKWGKKKSTGQTLIVPSYDGQTGMVSVVHRFR